MHWRCCRSRTPGSARWWAAIWGSRQGPIASSSTHPPTSSRSCAALRFEGETSNRFESPVDPSSSTRTRWTERSAPVCRRAPRGTCARTARRFGRARTTTEGRSGPCLAVACPAAGRGGTHGTGRRGIGAAQHLLRGGVGERLAGRGAYLVAQQHLDARGRADQGRSGGERLCALHGGYRGRASAPPGCPYGPTARLACSRGAAGRAGPERAR
jgi:hypothetical protein